MSKESKKSPQEYRERIIDDIINMRSGHPHVTPLFLAFSAEVCQICGDIGYLEGMAFGKARICVKGTFEFVHGTCGRRSREESAEILSRQRYRFCEFCRKQFRHTKDNHFERGWLCPECMQGIEPKDPKRVRGLINDVRRGRFLEPKSNDELRDLHISLTVQQFEWESDDPLQKLSPLEQLQFEVTREKRLEALLKRLSDFHGMGPSEIATETPNQDEKSRNVIGKDGDIWTITFKGDSVRLRDLKGLTYIVYLLQHPNEIISATQLVYITEKQPSGIPNEMSKQQIEEAGLSQVVDFGDAGEAADSTTMKELRKRLLEIEDEKTEAQRLADFEKYDKLEEETEQLKQ